MWSTVRQRASEWRDARRPGERMVSLRPTAGRSRGRALVSYLREPVRWRASDRRLGGHTNKWECREIVSILRSAGFAVDVIDWQDHGFEPPRRYDLVLALDGELSRLSELARPSVRLLHLTGAHGPFQNAAELARIEALWERRGVRCAPRRLVADVAGAVQALADATACSLIGNEWTLSTYPEQHRPKITRVPVTGSVPAPVRSREELAPPAREFLWFFGSGAVHKGLDRVLDAFADLPEQTLRIVGNVDAEDDFWAAYADEAALPNIHRHGFLDPAGREFARATAGCFCLVAPSCSEATSTATVTMLQLGLVPLVSRETGVTLHDGMGRYLEACSSEEIRAGAIELAGLDDATLTAMAARSQSLAREAHSRPAFTRAMRAYLVEALR